MAQAVAVVAGGVWGVRAVGNYGQRAARTCACIDIYGIYDATM